MPRADSLDDLIMSFRRYRRNAAAFAREMLGADPTEDQEEALLEISDPGAHVSIRSGHGTGKTALLSWVVLWHVACFEDCKIPCTAPTGHQLSDLLWAEMGKWHAMMPSLLRKEIVISADHVFVREAHKTRFAVGRTSRPETPEALAGFHATNLLYVIDEASGIPEKTFETAEGALSTPGARVIMTSNPTRTDGYFHASHHKDRPHWTCLQFSCLNNHLVDPAYPKRMASKYGPDSDVYRVRVLGEFPLGSADAVIPLDWVEVAVGRDIDPAGSTAVAGLDVARFGDDSSALVIRTGQCVTYTEQWFKQDTMYTTGKAVQAYQDGLFKTLYVDVIGVGSGVVDRLKELQVPVVGVNVAESAAHGDRFYRLRDQLWWDVREWFEVKTAAISPDCKDVDTLIGELTAPTYSITSKGQIKVESKDDMRRRGIASPNLADALCLTFARGTVPMANTVRTHEIQPAQGWAGLRRGQPTRAQKKGL